MSLFDLAHLLAALSGVLVGFTLGLVGGGGSILAVPLMVYVVGVRSPHVAIGTSALAVAANALVGLFNHARAHNVTWSCGGAYAAAGVIGALAGSSLGKAFDGQKLLFLFALYYRLVPAAASSRLASIQAWLHIGGAVIFPAGIITVLTLGPRWEIVPVAGALIVLAATVLFAVIVWRHEAR